MKLDGRKENSIKKSMGKILAGKMDTSQGQRCKAADGMISRGLPRGEFLPL